MQDKNSGCDSSTKSLSWYVVAREKVEGTIPRIEQTGTKDFLLEPSLTALRCIIMSLFSTVLFVFLQMFLHRDYSRNFNEVNDVPVTSGFRLKKERKKEEICFKRNLIDEFLQQDYKPKHMARSTETLFKNTFCHQLFCFMTGFSYNIWHS